MQDAHDQAYSGGNAAGLPASGMGAAAAMQAFKMFTGGGASTGAGAPAGAGGATGAAGASAGAAAGGNPQSQMLAMAMAEASKLFDSQGGAASGNKQEAITSAAKMAMKLLMQVSQELHKSGV